MCMSANVLKCKKDIDDADADDLYTAFLDECPRDKWVTTQGTESVLKAATAPTHVNTRENFKRRAIYLDVPRSLKVIIMEDTVDDNPRVRVTDIPEDGVIVGDPSPLQ